MAKGIEGKTAAQKQKGGKCLRRGLFKSPSEARRHAYLKFHGPRKHGGRKGDYPVFMLFLPNPDVDHLGKWVQAYEIPAMIHSRF